jgi:uncharacterized membrane protein
MCSSWGLAAEVVCDVREGWRSNVAQWMLKLHLSTSICAAPAVAAAAFADKLSAVEGQAAELQQQLQAAQAAATAAQAEADGAKQQLQQERQQQVGGATCI